MRHNIFFFLNDTATTEIYTLPLHDALPILTLALTQAGSENSAPAVAWMSATLEGEEYTLVTVQGFLTDAQDRKSTRLNSSHANISYAVFCLKKKKTVLNYH